MQLCDGTTSQIYGSVRCHIGYGQCKGAAKASTTGGDGQWADNCYPYGIWSNTKGSGTQYLDTELYNGSLNVDIVRPHTLAFSVRRHLGHSTSCAV